MGQDAGSKETPSKIEDYALIGDCETAALVSRDGSIDWLCWPRFDGGACFCALLGKPQNGRWLIAPADSAVRTTRKYLDHTLILETTHTTKDGVVVVTDFMPLRGLSSDVVRIVTGKSGQVRMRMELILRFDYGSIIPWVTRIDDRTISAIAGPDRAILRSHVPLIGQEMKTVGEWTISEGETKPFVLSYSASHLPPPAPINAEKALKETEHFWRDWCSKARPVNKYSEPVMRSLITLKALTYRPTGGVVAAPTTSLPEQLGGTRNWDYRYCWLRDTTFTLLALMNSGYLEEAKAWREWLLRAIAGSPSQAQIMYGIAGERRLTEWEVPWLDGYEGAKPVRVGNAAANQLQLDIYGEVMDATHQGRLITLSTIEAGWELQVEMVRRLESVWQQPDEGIWEIRGGPQQFTYSKVMAWVAFDRSIKSAERFGLPGPIERWKKIRAQIHDEVCEKAYNPDVGAFVSRYGSKALDASTLFIALVGFLPPDDPRVKNTVEAIQRNLTSDGFVMRYDTGHGTDGLPPGEGAFLACSFWLVDNLCLLGRHDEATKMYERLLSLSNDVGLLAEEYDPNAKRQVGNFPQAFTHIAVINSAHNLTRIENPAGQRADEHGGPDAAEPKTAKPR